ncbi:MAG: PIN domain-containing protein [Haloplanus sp.]
MTFLDSSTIIEYLRGDRTVTGYLDERQPWWTSTICVFEVLNGPAGSPGFDPVEERGKFSGVQALEFNEQLALEAARLQHAAIRDGSELSHRDAMIAATARSTGDEYVVADSDFETDPLEDVMDVTNLHSDDGG